MNKYQFVFSTTVFLLLLLGACSNKKSPQHSFCYWKTSIDFSEEDVQILDTLDVSHLYIRYFDVDWNRYSNMALPIATIKSYWGLNIKKQDITPVVFITNDVMLNATRKDLDDLAEKVIGRIKNVNSKLSESYQRHFFWEYSKNDYSSQNTDSIAKFSDSLNHFNDGEFNSKIKDILIDCDWNIQSKENYFYFLKKVKSKISPKWKVSATLRLWQYNNRNISGIPPVERVLLMCYNIESPKKQNIQNSIVSINELEQYLTEKNYPLKLDIALPLYSWGVLFKNGSFYGLLNDVKRDDFISDTIYYKMIKPNVFEFRRDMEIADTYVREGDYIRIEELSSQELENLVVFLGRKINLEADSRITLFSWDRDYINKYGVENLKKYYHYSGN